MRRAFKEKVVVITGAAGGLGAALSRRFAVAGAKLGLLDLNEMAVLGLARDLRLQGAECVALGLDVTDEQACRAALSLIADRLGGIDVMINNAGITHRSAFAHTRTYVFRKVMEVNLFGSIYCAQAALESLRSRKGQIIVISSIAGFSPLLGRTGYAASKHALHGLFESLRVELRRDGVGVLMVCPGFTRTNISHSALDGDGGITDHPQSTVGKAAAPGDVAEAIYRAAEKNKRLLVLSTVGKLTRLMMKFSPALYERMMAYSLRSELER